MQQAAGSILFEDVRGYALSRLDPNLGPSERSAALTAIDETLYGLMMVLDGVTERFTIPSARSLPRPVAIRQT